MKIYVAASYPRKAEALRIANRLKELGHQITSRWLTEDEGYVSDDREQETVEQMKKRMAEAAVRDILDVGVCELLVCLTDGEPQLSRGGRHAEFGMALAWSKQLILIGPRECVFHYHGVKVYEDEGDFWYDVDLVYGT